MEQQQQGMAAGASSALIELTEAASGAAQPSSILAMPRCIKQEVIFATDRDYKDAEDHKADYGFGKQQQDGLRYGRACVTLPTVSTQWSLVDVSGLPNQSL